MQYHNLYQHLHLSVDSDYSGTYVNSIYISHDLMEVNIGIINSNMVFQVNGYWLSELHNLLMRPNWSCINGVYIYSAVDFKFCIELVVNNEQRVVGIKLDFEYPSISFAMELGSVIKLNDIPFSVPVSFDEFTEELRDLHDMRCHDEDLER